ncbi:efflux RND transporter periplasmic adaptor subunit [Flavobacterium agricola]|uniref:Efflux RND transporter periplasmic adaptor subunit n=1 Tax=Flavobacterium agricola TaxID=2870839 RepID=A0ABY6LZJ9_9FLAO|nr:efflux RND transporter periplasmic adaptor subunit [Flavobacterium agricola]UYW01706.1 efflux RND transporter periplasmic adaptor subunit [Flavobacterium agricola]
MKKKSTFLIVLLLVALLALIFYRISKNSQAAAGAKAAPKSAAISAMVLEAQVFNDELTVSGTLEANEETTIHSEVSALVSAISFQEGTQVAKGQVLVKLVDTELKAQVAQAKNKMKLAWENLKRAKLLLEKEAISREEFEFSETDFLTAESALNIIQAQLDKTTIRAPFSGTIGLRNISAGSYITPATAITNLVNADPIKITFSIPEKYAAQVKNNTELNFTVTGNPKVYTAKVFAVEPLIDVMTRTLTIKAICANPNNELIPGSFANINLPLTTLNDALLVPAEALIPVQNGKKVFVYSQGKAKEVMVETGTRTNKDVLVIEGLKAGDTLLTSGIMMLRHDQNISVNLNK